MIYFLLFVIGTFIAETLAENKTNLAENLEKIGFRFVQPGEIPQALLSGNKVYC